MNDLMIREEICIYNRYGFILMIFNPWGCYWNIWMITKEYLTAFRGTVFHSDLWYCIHALVTILGRE